jgi:long-chain acyl-CoA synthetase
MAADYPWLQSYPENVDWHVEIPAKPLTSLLDDAAEQWPERPAIEFLGTQISYRELAVLVNRAASGLKALGVKRGVKVGICLPNCPQFVIAYYAILKTGATVVNYSPLYTARELAHQIQDSGTEMMVTMNLQAIYPQVAANLGKTCLKKLIITSLTEALPPLKAALFPLLKGKEIAKCPQDAQHILWKSLLAHEPIEKAEDIHPESDVAVLQYTGGTTGTPKGVVLTHANLFINTLQCGMWFPDVERGGETVMGVLPLFHVFAMTTVMNFALHIGAQMKLHPKVDIAKILKDIHQNRPTLMPGVATLFTAINNYNKLSRYRLDSLKFCISGGGPLPLEVKRRFEELTGCALVEGYGLSEASPVTHCNPIKGENRTGSIGFPFPGTVAEIVDKEDKTTLLPVGEVGELCIRGPQVMQGYWQNMDETNHCLRDGRLHTGDLARMDEDGYFYIVDRLKEMIISGGYNIYPRQVEEAIYQHEAVAECAVIGVPDEKWGETPKAFIVVKEGHKLDEDTLKSFLRTNLASYAKPRIYEFRKELPKTMIGKVDKKQLKG